MTTTEKTRKPRMTIAERNKINAEREAEVAAAAMVSLTTAWPTRLMKNLERATNVYLDIEVINGKFKIAIPFGDFVQFGIVPDGTARNEWDVTGDFDAMDTLESYLTRREEELAEAERVSALRKNAMSKLTAEEREVLGL